MGVLFCFSFSVLLLISDMKNMIAEAVEDASQVTWAHAVNSRATLLRELAGPIDFLEADVSLGHVRGNVSGPPQPIMAHPPARISDISLEDWLDILISCNSTKGVKLDFKSLEVVEPSLRILQAYDSQLNFTLWLNADILFGPVNATVMPVKEDSYLQLCKQYFPEAIISAGWTTRLISQSSKSTWHYEWKHVRKMADVIRCFGYKQKTPTFTFPVRGIYASRSIKKLQWLLGVIPGSSLTVWTSILDPLTLEDLLRIRKSFPKDKVYYDIPNRTLMQSFEKAKQNETFEPRLPPTFKDNEWMVLNRGKEQPCALNTYVSNNTIVFGSSPETAVLLKKVIFGDLSQSLKVYGKVKFFNSYNQPPVGKHKLTIALTDISLFSKNSSGGENEIDVSGSDTEVLWEALNTSHLYTFEHDFSEKPHRCRVFKLDSTINHSFQAWTVPCDEIDEQKSFDELTSNGRPEISQKKRMVLPNKPFMFGFISSGYNNVVLFDFEIEGENQHTTSSSSRLPIAYSTITLFAFSLLVGYIVQRYCI